MNPTFHRDDVSKEYSNPIAVRAILYISLFLVVLSCRDEQTLSCDVQDPIENLPWLKDLVAEKAALPPDPGIGYYIYIGKYQGRDVIIDDICCPTCDYLPIVYECGGNKVEDANVYSAITDRRLLWRSATSPCSY